jgi:hypothetical protein
MAHDRLRESAGKVADCHAKGLEILAGEERSVEGFWISCLLIALDLKIGITANGRERGPG